MSIVQTLHDLLDFHLESGDLSALGFVALVLTASDAVDGQSTVSDRSNVIILHEDHLVGVLDDGTGTRHQGVRHRHRVKSTAQGAIEMLHVSGKKGPAPNKSTGVRRCCFLTKDFYIWTLLNTETIRRWCSWLNGLKTSSRAWLSHKRFNWMHWKF